MSATSGNSSAAPNWYPDPADARLLRYWDGTQWTEHTSPTTTWTAGAPPATAAPGGRGSHKTLWIVLGSVVGGLILIGGILAVIATPVFLNQRAKAQDTAAKADVATLGMEIAIWYVDNDGPPPTISVRDGHYLLDGTDIGPVGTDVELGGQTGSDWSDWCVWVTNPNGDLKDFQYSTTGLDQGNC